MPDGDLLKFTVLQYSATELKISVTNNSGGSLNKSLMIELFPPTYLVSEDIDKAAKASMITPLAGAIDKFVKGPAGWSFWAKATSITQTLMIEIDNDVDQATDQQKTPVELAADASFIITIPLKVQTTRQDIQLAYKYEYDSTHAFEGKLELKTDATTWQPEVTLTAGHSNPIAIKPGTFVKIEWSIKFGVSATLYGPLMEGNSFLILSPEPDEAYKISGALSKFA